VTEAIRFPEAFRRRAVYAGALDLTICAERSMSFKTRTTAKPGTVPNLVLQSERISARAARRIQLAAESAGCS
jgi:hypothetical protein